MFSEVLKYYHTIKHLKLIQLYGQVTFRLKKPRIHSAKAPKRRPLHGSWTTPILKSEQNDLPTQLNFLNQKQNILSSKIWNDKQTEKLWLYNLHYFDFIHSSYAEDHPQWCNAFMHRWINENPPSHGCGWEPYTLSLRIVNWIKWIIKSSLISSEILHSLAIQVRYLSKRLEIHLLGNHILANAKALLFAGLFFEGKEAETWYNKGLKLLTRELSEQVLPDGGHFELSPMYHSIIFEDLLDIINVSQAYGQSIPPHYQQLSQSMHHWLKNLCHLDGHISFFNDAALSIAPTLAELEAYLERLKLHQNVSNQALIHFQHSGYCRLKFKDLLLLADIANIGASYQPGHGHADTLSFELSYGQQRIIVNSGTSCYSNSPERLRQRGSKAHNTLVINDTDSSEVWKSFRVARRARVFNIETHESENKMLLKATHDGYARSKQLFHTRLWTMTEDEILIEDTVTGSGSHKIEIFFHIHPNIKLIKIDDKKIFFYNQFENHIGILETSVSSQIKDSTYHPEFNLSITNKKIVLASQQNLPAYFYTTIKFNPKDVS